MDYLDYLFDWAGIGESTSPQVWHSAIQSDLRRHSQNPFSSSHWFSRVFSSSRPIHIQGSVLSTSPGWGCPPGGAPVGKEGSGIAAVSPCCKRWILISMNFRIVNWTRPTCWWKLYWGWQHKHPTEGPHLASLTPQLKPQFQNSISRCGQKRNWNVNRSMICSTSVPTGCGRWQRLSLPRPFSTIKDSAELKKWVWRF